LLNSRSTTLARANYQITTATFTTSTTTAPGNYTSSSRPTGATAHWLAPTPTGNLTETSETNNLTSWRSRCIDLTNSDFPESTRTQGEKR